MNKIFLGFKVEGQKNFGLIKSKQYIVIANHRSYFDGFLLDAAVPFSHFLTTSFRFMVKPKYMEMYPFLWLLGGYPIYRTGNAEQSLELTEKLLKQGKHLLIFPEGTFDKDKDQPMPARRGIGYLARKYNLPIVPMAIIGAHGISLKNYFYRKNKVSIKIGKPFYYNEVGNDNDTDLKLAEKVMERVNVMI